MADYLHGVEIKQVAQGTKSIAVVNTAVIGLVGIAEKGNVNEPTLITSMKDAKEKFGNDVAGTTIIGALQTIFDNGGAACIVVNVADPDKMIEALDENNKIRKIEGKYATQLYAPALSMEEGFVDFTGDMLKGIELLLVAESSFGIKPKLLIVPGYSHHTAVVQKMATVAERLRAKAFSDIQAKDVTEAIKKRGEEGNSSSNRIVYCYPNVVRYNEDEKEENTVGLSQYYATGCVARDNNEGYWYSPSNYEVVGILKSATPIVSSLTDKLADSNMLNGAGICTLFRSYGTGYRLWGNWTASFPTSNDLKNMIAPGRVADVVDESIQQASLQFMDRAVGKVLIDCILNSVNQFLRTLMTRGAIVDGVCICDKDKNPATEIAQGKLVFSYSFAPAPSLDRLTFESYVDIEMLKKVFG